MNIWVPRTKIIEPRDAFKMPGMKVAGWYTLRTTNRFTGKVVRELGPFPNLITDAGLDAVAGGVTIDEMRVGTGNATPDVSDAALQTQVAISTNIQSTSTAINQTADRYSSVAKTWRFSAPGSAHNLAEIGVYSTADVLFSRALIVDGGGSPTTFPWAADEILDATYTLRRYPDLTDTMGTISIGGVGSRDITCRVLDVDTWYSGLTSMTLSAAIATSGVTDNYHGSQAWTGVLGAITDGSPTGSSLGKCNGNATNASYSAGSFVRGATTIYGTSTGNGSCRTFEVGYHGGGFAFPYHEYQVQLDTAFTKLNTQTLALYWQIGWGRR